jgi:hypothetical protein
MHASVQISGDITKRLAPERKNFKGWILVEVQIGEIQGVKFVTQRMFLLLINSSVLEESAKAVC